MYLNHEERRDRVLAYVNSLDSVGEIVAEKEYPRYSVFRMVLEDVVGIVQFQIFKNGTIMRDGKEVLNWIESEALAA